MKTPSEIGLARSSRLDAARATTGRRARLEAFTQAGAALHAELKDGPHAQAMIACDLVTLPYPTSYAMAGATWLPWPFIWFTHRMLVVRFRDPAGATKTLLFNPTDHLQARTTPYFAHLAAKSGDFLAHTLLSRVHGTFESELAALGVKPSEVDYVAFDHLHTQDIRRHAGTTQPVAAFGPALLAAALPNAHFLIPKQEFAIWQDPHPLQHGWFVPRALDGLDTSRVVLLDGDYQLGDGVWLVFTPGHTMGNQSLVVSTRQGVYVTSENGVSSCAYVPQHSGIPGLSTFARERGLEVILNSNTLESSLDQYDSMILEKSIAGPCPANPRFPNVYPSSELTFHPLAPGLSGAFSHGRVRTGSI